MRLNTNLIKAELTKKGLTQEKLAELVGIGTTSISLKLNGKRQFKIDELILVSKVLNVEPSFFLETT